MHIHHIALYGNDIEKLKDFYTRYFEGKANEKYTNEDKGFSSYFIHFDQGACLEIMHKFSVTDEYKQKENMGYTHLAFSLGSVEAVDEKTQELQENGFKRLEGPRWTGDGYYEVVFLDPEDNRIEITL